MSTDRAKKSAETATRLSEVSPDAQAALLVHLLENNPSAMDDILANREWTGGSSSQHGSGWPTHQNDHRGESNPRGRGST